MTWIRICEKSYVYHIESSELDSTQMSSSLFSQMMIENSRSPLHRGEWLEYVRLCIDFIHYIIYTFNLSHFE